MSAPDTNTKKQAERHKPALLGMGSAILFALLLLLGLIVFLFATGGAPDNEQPQVDGRTGETEVVPE